MSRKVKGKKKGRWKLAYITYHIEEGFDKRTVRIDRHIHKLDITISPENLPNMLLSDILCQFLNDDLYVHY